MHSLQLVTIIYKSSDQKSGSLSWQPQTSSINHKPSNDIYYLNLTWISQLHSQCWHCAGRWTCSLLFISIFGVSISNVYECGWSLTKHYWYVRYRSISFRISIPILSDYPHTGFLFCFIINHSVMKVKISPPRYWDRFYNKQQQQFGNYTHFSNLSNQWNIF